MIPPAAATTVCSRCSLAVSRIGASNAPTAAPANRNPAHGNAVNCVTSPAGRRYHCTHVGSPLTSALAPTIGVIIANAMERAAYEATSPLVVLLRPHTRPAATIEG